MRLYFGKLFFLGSFLWTSFAFSQETYKADAKREPAKDSQNILQDHLWLFGGVDLGYSILRTSVDGEEHKSGLGGNLKFLLSNYWDRWVLDAGFGIGYKHISGTRPSGFEGTLETRTLLFEIGGRRRFLERWEAGMFIVAHTLADVSHRPTTQPLISEPEKGLIFMTGVQALYDFDVQKLPIRAGLRVATDLDIPHRRLWEVQAVIQMGFPLSGSAPQPVPPREAKKTEYFEIPFLRVHFQTDSAEITKASVNYLERLGAFLKKNLDKFTRIEIEGHTDQVGGYTYNIDLSQRRAEKVESIFTAQGIPKAVLLSKGYGYNKPVAEKGDNADEKNRRVLIRLVGATEEKKTFIDELRVILKN